MPSTATRLPKRLVRPRASTSGSPVAELADVRGPPTTAGSDGESAGVTATTLTGAADTTPADFAHPRRPRAVAGRPGWTQSRFVSAAFGHNAALWRSSWYNVTLCRR